MTAPAGSEGVQGDPGAAGETAPEGTEAPTGEEALGDAGKRALQAERDARAAAEAKVREYEKAKQDAERAKLSADERTALERTEATERADKAERELARLRVVVDKKVPTEFADRLVGNTAEELAADADKLLAALSAHAGQAPPDPGGRAREVLPSGGGDPTSPVGEVDGRKIAAAIPRRY